MFSNIYASRKVLVTGHTGFKGSWLALWLKRLGAEVVGFSDRLPASRCHWSELNLDIEDIRGDVNDLTRLQDLLLQFEPEIVFHLAAQPLVRQSYIDPVGTWQTNAMGTLNVLESCRRTGSVRAVVVVTSDKCYENLEQQAGYSESDRLGGHDPYSSSKAAAELVVSSYRKSFSHTWSGLIATGRAGNVIGGGDWSKDRLIPDVVRSVEENKSVEIRFPTATRPWQHVLESLSGYLVLGQGLLEGRSELAEPWNFGPAAESNRSVEYVLSEMVRLWPGLRWHKTDIDNPHEAGLLHLNSSKSMDRLAWRPVWGIRKSIEETTLWYRSLLEGGELISEAQLLAYVSDARVMRLSWASC